ncbi:choline/ethanolamine kinase family protein [Rhizobium miluonense]|uniref:Thiamine kinase n=1 Tax=Rhizobium miluonense TaxID=411945 RepID=A0A1C3VK78_9HYPH|nr:choline/ethanolamine kinase family protein [Rhizobium miluonense]SCB27884.1 Thiamine kinase [Rhizobium miluonense]
MTATPEDRIHSLAIWRGPLEIAPLVGGITNRNYLVTNDGQRFVVRLGSDIPVHHISRTNEVAASRAAHAAGLSPAVIYYEPGILVLDYIDARPLSADDIRTPAMISRIVPLIRSCHRDVARHFRGPAAIFWVFHVVRDYAALLEAGGSRHKPLLPSFLDIAERLECAAGPFEIAFCHNDLLAANFLDDGKRLWLIDWDYAGFNTPLFDLGGLASNNEFTEAEEEAMLEAYFEAGVSNDLRRRYQAMKCASLLRETMWSMVSEIHSDIDFDYSSYTAENLRRFESAWQSFRNS